MPRPSRMSPGIPRPTLLPALLILLLSAALALTTLTVPARAAAPGGAWTVREPGAPRDGVTAVVRLDPADGTLTLTARKGAVTVLEPAPLGIVTSAADLTSGLRAESRRTRQVTERYSMTTGKQLRRTARMTETRFTFTGRDGARLQLVVRVADDGVAYRYVLPGSGTVTVEREASAFRPPADARAWLTPYSVNYERLYAQTTAAGAAPGAYAYPALFQVGDTYALLTESDVDGRYDASRLVHEGDGRYTVRLADPAVTSEGPLATPWRTAVVGDLATVTESTLVDDLAPASRIADTSWIRPGKVAWSWLDGFGPAQRDLAAQQRFVDLAAAHGWPYTLVDDGWKTTDWMPELIAYARERGVDVLLWVHYTDDLDTAAERAEFLPRVTEWGAAGLKIDFMDSDSQERFRWYDDILEDTARYRLLVNFHGATLPKGHPADLAARAEPGGGVRRRAGQRARAGADGAAVHAQRGRLDGLHADGLPVRHPYRLRRGRTGAVSGVRVRLPELRRVPRRLPRAAGAGPVPGAGADGVGRDAAAVRAAGRGRDVRPAPRRPLVPGLRPRRCGGDGAGAAGLPGRRALAGGGRPGRRGRRSAARTARRHPPGRPGGADGRTRRFRRAVLPGHARTRHLRRAGDPACR